MIRHSRLLCSLCGSPSAAAAVRRRAQLIAVVVHFCTTSATQCLYTRQKAHQAHARSPASAQVDSTSVLQLTSYSLPELIEPLHIIKELHALVYSAPRDCAIRVKYSSADLDTVALLPPLPEPHVAHGSSAASEMEIETNVYVPIGGMAPVPTSGMAPVSAGWQHEQQQQQRQAYQSHGSCQQAGAGYLTQQHAATATSCC